MDRKSLFTGVVVIVLIALFPLVISCITEKGALLLVTPEEAALPEALPEPFWWHPKSLKPIVEGPSIYIVTPKSGSKFSAGDSFRLHVIIKINEGGPDVNMDSFKINYLKLDPVDITERLRDYIKGTELDVPATELPPEDHNHRFKFSVKDMKGNGTAETLYIQTIK